MVDNDLAFLFWLGAALRDAGFQTVPAKNATAGRALLPQIGEDLRGLIVNPVLPGSGRLIRDLRRRYPRLRVVAALESGAADLPVAGADIRLAKPAQYDEVAVAAWSAALRGLEVTGSAPHAL
jgi:hypothetical protein